MSFKFLFINNLIFFYFLGFMTKNPLRRLGCTGNENQIRNHAFFREFDWDALEARKVRPPFRPRVVCFTDYILNNKN